MTALRVPVLVSLALSLLAAPAWGAANVALTPVFVSVDPACDLPQYNFTGTADFSVNDDGGGNDWLAFVYHDESGNYHDTDYAAVQTPAGAISSSDDFLGSLSFSSFLQSRPLVVRVHDIGTPVVGENTKESIEFISAAPVLLELRIDPADNAAACSAKRLNNWALRIDSMKNGGGQTLTTIPANINLDGLGTTVLTLAVAENSNLFALFRGECAHDGASNDAWTNIDIRVDGLPLPPTGSADAFCTSNGSAGLDEWVMPRTSGAIFLPGPSVHSVDVIGRTTSGTASLGDMRARRDGAEPSAWLQRCIGLAAVALLARLRRRTRLAAKLASCAGFAVLGASLSWTPAHADTVLLHTQNGANQIVPASAGATLLDLGSGMSFPVNLSRNTRVAILFTAECTSNAAGTASWVNLNIRVDGVAVPDSGQNDDAFCTSPGNGNVNFVSVGYHVTIDLAPGGHFVEVQAQLQNFAVATEQWWIGDLSLSVIGQEF